MRGECEFARACTAAALAPRVAYLFGWMGTTLAVYRMVPQLRYEMHWYALMIVAVISVMGVIWYPGSPSMMAAPRTTD